MNESGSPTTQKVEQCVLVLIYTYVDVYVDIYALTYTRG